MPTSTPIVPTPGQVSLSMARGDTLPFALQVIFNPLTAQVQAIQSNTIPPPGWSFGMPTGYSLAKILWTAKFYVAQADVKALVQLNYTTGGPPGGITTTAGWIVTVTVPASSTVGLADSSPTVLVWDIQFTDTLGNIATLAYGSLTVFPDVTRST